MAKDRWKGREVENERIVSDDKDVTSWRRFNHWPYPREGFIFQKIHHSALIFHFFNMHHKGAKRAGARGEPNEQ